MNEYLFLNIGFIIYSILIYKYRKKIALRLKLMDFPDNKRKSHFKPIPSLGGIIIFPYILSAIVLFNNLSLIKTKILLIWFFLFTSFFFIGLVDDRYNLSAKTKTFILIFILFITLPLDKSMVIQSLYFKDLDLFISLNEGSLFFTIFCIYLFYNALNFSDGYNGISITTSIYFLFAIILSKGSFDILLVSVILSLVIILIPNLSNKIFIGNSGVSLVSIVLSVLVINSYSQGFILFDEIILIFFIPTIDAVRITVERIINGKSPFESDKNHFHHLLSKIINRNYVFVAYLIISIMPYLITKTNIATYYSMILFGFLYLFCLYFLKIKKT